MCKALTSLIITCTMIIAGSKSNFLKGYKYIQKLQSTASTLLAIIKSEYLAFVFGSIADKAN